MKSTFTKEAPEAIGSYSQGMIVNNMFYSSGQVPLTKEGQIVEGGIEAQVHQVFANLQAVLKSAGAALSTVVKTTVFIKNMEDFTAINEIYGMYFKEHLPARSCVAVAGLPKNADVEIEVIALIK